MDKQNPNYLDADESILSSKLRFIKSEYEDELNTIFGGDGGAGGDGGGGGTLSPDSAVVSSGSDNNNAILMGGERNKYLSYKIVIPEPGCCMKFIRQYDDSKIFVNLCTTTDIPAPRDVTTKELMTILKTTDLPSTFRIPMSISELRRATDKSGKLAQVFDIAINPVFFGKFQTERIFYEFMITLICETIDSKFNIAVDRNSMVKLKHRKCIGSMITHRVENRDIQMVADDTNNYNNRMDSMEPSSQQILIEDMTTTTKNDRNHQTFSAGTTKKLKPIEQFSTAIGQKNKRTTHSDSDHHPSALKRPTKTYKHIEYRLIYDNDEYNIMINRSANDKSGDDDNNFFLNCYIIGEFYMPNCTGGGASEITLELGDDRITIESRKRGYLLDEFLGYTIDPSRSISDFDMKRKVLTVKMPIISGIN